MPFKEKQGSVYRVCPECGQGFMGSMQTGYAQGADTSFLKMTRCCHCGAGSSGVLMMNSGRNTTSSYPICKVQILIPAIESSFGTLQAF